MELIPDRLILGMHNLIVDVTDVFESFEGI